MVGLTILGGYLGVGKTTLLNHILLNNRSMDGEPKRIALLINDFGDINIDAQLIESQSDKQINLANGCVCCTLNDGFTDALDNLLALVPQPEHIIVEASGVADVGNLSQYGNGQELMLSGVIVVADAETVREKAKDKYVSRTITRQLKTADLLLVNKIDLIQDGVQKNLLAWLSELTDGVPAIPSVRCNVPLDVIFGLEHLPSDMNDTQHEHQQYTGWSFQSIAPVARKDLEAFMQSLDRDVLRCKGLFENAAGGTLELQVVGKRKEIIEHESSSRKSNQLIAIGLQQSFQIQKLEESAGRFFS